ncbi:MAG: AAA family ATPase [Candidatus Gastranaerophilales bacterium]|nr:AAA family ATPase [Candidatus Gastranaerophilales bacterium]
MINTINFGQNNSLYGDFTRPSQIKKQAQEPIEKPAVDTFNDKHAEENIENKSFFKKAKDYLLTPIDTPQYTSNGRVYNRKMTRLQKFGSYAFLGLIYGFMIFYMIKSLKVAGVDIKPESLSSYMKKYREDLSHAPNLKDLALPDVLKGTVERLMNKIKDSETFIQKGGTNKNTILLFGPPGTGKTTVARAIAKEIHNAELYSVDLSTIQGKFVGESEGNLDKVIRNICEYAKENPNKKVVVLMDELDSIAMKDNGSSDQQYHASLLNVLKRGISEKLTRHDNIILIATTNAELNKVGDGSEFIQKLDYAIADRFGEQIRVDNPTKEQFIKAIVQHYGNLSKVEDVLKHEDSEPIVKIAEELAKNNCSFRALQNLFNASAATSKGEKLTPDDILSALPTCIASSKAEAKQQTYIKGFGRN